MHEEPVRFERVLSWLAQPRVPWIASAVALLLLAPGMCSGLVLDDYVLAVKARPVSPVVGLPSDPAWLFTFTTGDVARNRALMDEGVLLPWWTEPRHLNAFFRPLSSLSHVLDFRLWPESAPLMHLHSMLWYAALLFVLAYVYRVLESGWLALAGLALVLFALDDAHGATVGWVANRNALLAATLALPALSAQHRFATGGFPAGAWLGPLFFALGLCAGETAVSVLGYVLAHALCLDPRRWQRRALSLLPYAALLLAHSVLSRVLGLGSFGSAAYHHPLHEPFGFLGALAYNLPLLLSSEVFFPLADFAFWGEPAARAMLWCISLLGLGIFGWAILGSLKADPRARFWALGLVLSAIPVSASLPGERLLLVLGVGACPLLARILLRPASAARGRALVVAMSTAGLFALVHLLLAPALLPVRARAMSPLVAAMDRLDAGLPRSPDVTDKTAIVINAPVTLMLSYLQIKRAARAVPRPAHLYVLSSAGSILRVTRSGERSLRLELEHGFLYRPEETHYRADAQSLVQAGRVELTGLQISLREQTADGRPKSAEFSFTEPLESSRYLWRVYRAGELVPWHPPALGRGEEFQAEDFFRIVQAEMAR